MNNKIITVFISLLFIATAAVAHQPRIPQGVLTEVTDPEISKAYYAKLSGTPHVYTISSEKPFPLYVNILVPDLPGQKRDLSVAIVRDGDGARPLAVLDGTKFTWKRFFEKFGHDTYWMGPEFKAQVPAGTYRISVTNPGNDTKYSLAVGEMELFDFKETRSALTLIPQIKRGFFQENPADFILSPLGWGLILLMYLLAFVMGSLYRLWVKRTKKDPLLVLHKPASTGDRVFRALFGAGLLAWAVTTSWNPALLFLSGLALFGALFSRPS